jgi:pyridoxine/pyridoxamine 5'-phosphate oxidase
MVEWFTDLEATLDQTWQTLADGIADPTSAARHPTLATAGRDGAPKARTVVLRAAERGPARLDVHSDAAAAKIGELRAEPRLSLHIWEPRSNLQLRLRGEASILTGAAVADIWCELPASARENYGGAPAPGTPIAEPGVYAAAVDPARFAVVRCALGEIETLHLGPDRHRRARFRRADDWNGTWLAP